MPQYLTPGVYIEEIPGQKPIASVGTATGAFVGIAEKGQVGKPTLITNLTQFRENFGDPIAGWYLADAVRQFFTEGGTRCYVVRTACTAVSSTATLPPNALIAKAVTPGSDGDKIEITITDGTTPKTFKLIVKFKDKEEETYDGLTTKSDDSQYVVTAINEKSKYITIEPPAGGTISRPNNGTYKLEKGVNTALTSTVSIPSQASKAFIAEAKTPGTWGDRIQLTVEDGTGTTNFKLTIEFKATPGAEYEPQEIYDNLSVTSTDQQYIVTVINEKSKYIIIKPPTNGGTVSRPANGTYKLQNGDNGATGVTKENLWGKEGLLAFDPIDDINILAIPDSVKLSDVDLKATIIGAYGYCQNRKDCFFVADPPKSKNVQEISAFQTDTPVLNSSYAALYYPWLKPLIGTKDYIPPSGAIAGIYAATDIRRGVHNAPAGMVDGNLKSVIDVERQVTHGEQESLNPIGVNVIRSFPGAGLIVWGARTLSTDAEWKYVNVRRLFLFIEESIEEATQWVVFEPNTRSLWQTVKRDVTAFLTITWRSGALFGSTAEEAFFVKVDDENNPPEVRDLGRLVIDIGVAPVKPAEFVIFRISQKTLGA